MERENKVAAGESIPDFDETEQTSLEPLFMEDPLIDKIRNMDLDRTIPMDALLHLKEIQEDAKKRKK